MAPQRRKQIQQYMLSGERFVHIKDYSIPEPAQTMVLSISTVYTSGVYVFVSVNVLLFLQARDGNSVCVALSGQDGKYVIINIHEGNVCLFLQNSAINTYLPLPSPPFSPSPSLSLPLSPPLSLPSSPLQMFDLLSYEPGCTPIIRRMGKVSQSPMQLMDTKFMCVHLYSTVQGEFLVNAGSFGITTTITGMSNVSALSLILTSTPHSPSLPSSLPLFPPPFLQRPPVEWGSECPPKAATYVFPYIVAWSQEAGIIRVFNLVHQRCVQEIPFSVSYSQPILARQCVDFTCSVCVIWFIQLCAVSWLDVRVCAHFCFYVFVHPEWTSHE